MCCRSPPSDTSVSAALGLTPTTPTSCGGLMKRLPAAAMGMGAGGSGSLVTQGLSSMETMQKSVMNAFSLKYSQSKLVLVC